MNDINSCPKCNVSLIGEPIPDEDLQYCEGYYWRREIRVEISEKYDGVYYWQCPDCSHTWGGYRAYESILQKE